MKKKKYRRFFCFRHTYTEANEISDVDGVILYQYVCGKCGKCIYEWQHNNPVNSCLDCRHCRGTRESLKCDLSSTVEQYAKYFRAGKAFCDKFMAK